MKLEENRTIVRSTSTPTVAKHRPSYKAKFITERNAKNRAYSFILSHKLLEKYRKFCELNCSDDPHTDCLQEVLCNIDNSPVTGDININSPAFKKEMA